MQEVSKKLNNDSRKKEFEKSQSVSSDQDNCKKRSIKKKGLANLKRYRKCKLQDKRERFDMWDLD